MTRLYLHIGHYKTGTSAIQAFCHQHADALAQNGLYYPKAGRGPSAMTNHAGLALPIAKDHGFYPPRWYQGGHDTDATFEALHDELGREKPDKALISSEELIQLALRDDPDAAIADLRHRLAPYDVRVILYLREPLSLLKSWYSQVARGPRPVRSFPSFFMARDARFFGQGALYDAFARGFGADKIVLRSYVDHGAAHIRSFLKRADVTAPDNARYPVVNVAPPTDDFERMRIEQATTKGDARLLVTQIDTPDALVETAARINADWARVTARTPERIESRLSARAVIAHYITLLEPAAGQIPLITQEADRLEHLAARCEAGQAELAAALTHAARIIRASYLVDAPAADATLSGGAT